MRIILAHYSAPKLIRTILFFGIILATAIALAFFSYQGQFISRVIAMGGIWPPVLLFSLLALAYAVWVEILFVTQALFDQRRALWVEHGTLVFLNKLYLSRKCKNIVAVSEGNRGLQHAKAIVLEMRNGKQTIIPSGAFEESVNEIIEKLKRDIL